MTGFDPVIWFFVLGLVASWMKSDLSFPDSISKFLSIYLLLSLGLKGGFQVSNVGELDSFTVVFGIGLVSCLLIPLYLFKVLQKRVSRDDAAALAACYGSVSAVTFITAKEFLKYQNIEFSGYMVAVMALMEIPAILVSMFLYNQSCNYRQNKTIKNLKSVLSGKSIVLLLGGFSIGMTFEQSDWDSYAPLLQTPFKGVLAFFLIDLGISAQKQLRNASTQKLTSVIVGFGLPLLHGSLAVMAANFMDITRGDQVLLGVLAGSASYIAAPAAIRATISGANPSLYVGLPLALTFPMNLSIGIPYYFWLSGVLAN